MTRATLRADLDRWSRLHRSFGFAGQNGGMFLNQLVRDGDPADVPDLLAAWIPPPPDDVVAADRIQALVALAQELRATGSSAVPRRSVPFLSWFWWMTEPKRWPVLWSSTWSAFEALGWVTSGQELSAQGELYVTYRQTVRSPRLVRRRRGGHPLAARPPTAARPRSSGRRTLQADR
jgi:hypothetical protein